MQPKNIPIPFPITWVNIPEGNYRVGRTMLPDTCVIHIAEGNKQSVISTFKDPSVQKSSHFLVCADGSVVQFVSTKNVAFCNGIVVNPVSELVLLRAPVNPNEYTFSIENEGYSTSDITEAQYKTNALILKYLHDAWSLPLNSTHVIRHREITSAKTCPGFVDVEKILQMSRKM